MRLFLLTVVLLVGAAVLMAHYPFTMALAVMFAGGILAALVFALGKRFLPSQDAGSKGIKVLFKVPSKSDDAGCNGREAA